MRFVIIGCGRVGAGLAQSLSQDGHTVAIIDHEPGAFTRLGTAFQGYTLTGHSFDRDILQQAGIGRSDGLAAVTGSDTINLVTARLARLVFHVPQVVARVYEPRKTEIYRQLGVQTLTPITWGIQRLADLLCYTPWHPSVSLGSGEVDLVEVELSPLLVGQTVHEVTVAGEMHVTAISRSGHTFLPTLGTVFQEGDRLHLTVLAASRQRLQALLG